MIIELATFTTNLSLCQESLISQNCSQSEVKLEEDKISCTCRKLSDRPQDTKNKFNGQFGCKKRKWSLSVVPLLTASLKKQGPIKQISSDGPVEPSQVHICTPGCGKTFWHHQTKYSEYHNWIPLYFPPRSEKWGMEVSKNATKAPLTSLRVAS